ncbi:MAG: YdeI/OmpD-associated family protein [Acidobacteriota bacterium]|nr:MAG: YdeI/OmpD-associated family protein [Acidobacteriota bacterium]
MPKTDPRIDAYIERSAEFAQPILTHIRKLIHKACPDVEETMKWSMPHFDFKGPLCNMAAFKQHCAFGFWKQQIMDHSAIDAERNTLSSFGKITSLKDLPKDKVIIELINQAIELNEKGIKIPKPKASEKAEIVVPDILAAELKKNKKAAETFDKFPPSCKREYIEWITDAKTEPTREKRLATTIEWLTEGKRKNWKYEKC